MLYELHESLMAKWLIYNLLDLFVGVYSKGLSVHANRLIAQVSFFIPFYFQYLFLFTRKGLKWAGT